MNHFLSVVSRKDNCIPYLNLIHNFLVLLSQVRSVLYQLVFHNLKFLKVVSLATVNCWGSLISGGSISILYFRASGGL